jgi:hypothetical protein
MRRGESSGTKESPPQPQEDLRTSQASQPARSQEGQEPGGCQVV